MFTMVTPFPWSFIRQTDRQLPLSIHVTAHVHTYQTLLLKLKKKKKRFNVSWVYFVGPPSENSAQMSSTLPSSMSCVSIRILTLDCIVYIGGSGSDASMLPWSFGPTASWCGIRGYWIHCESHLAGKFQAQTPFFSPRPHFSQLSFS